MKPKELLLHGMALLSVALCAATLLRTWTIGNDIARANSDDEIPPYLAVVEARMRELEERQEELSEQLDELPMPAAPAVAAPDSSALAERVSALMTRMDELQRRMVASDEGLPLDETEVDAAQYVHDALADFRSRALDVVRSPRERIAALDVLRRYPGGIDASVVQSMIGLIDDPTLDVAQRMHIVRNLSGVEDERLRDRFLTLLQSDASEKVRAEAAEGLATFVDEEDVRLVLALAAQHDASAEVRAEARAALEPRPER